MEDLQSLIKRVIIGVMNGELDDRIHYFVDYKSKYAVLKPDVSVKVELTDGKKIEFNITDYFKEVVK